MVTAAEALERLKQGNHRFASGESSPVDLSLLKKQQDGQKPFAVVLGCSDSRVPVEIVFDQTLGDLFVVRVAGNIAGPTQIGSIEFAIENFGSQLIVVLGHSGCGAVSATMAKLQDPELSIPSPHLRNIVAEIEPAIQDAMTRNTDAATQFANAIRANAQQVANNLTENSSVLSAAVQEGSVKIVAAEYALTTGQVEFF